MNSSSIIFADGSSVSDVDDIILGIGYDLKFPFLTSGGHLPIVPVPRDPREHADHDLSTNLRYIRPLHEHVLSLSSKYPLGSLYFIGLVTLTYYAANDMAQAMFMAHTLANPTLLRMHNGSLTRSQDARQKYLDLLRTKEDSLRAQGFNPDVEGHHFPGPVKGAQDYQDVLVEWLKERGVQGLPEDGFVEQWRRRAGAIHFDIGNAWRKVEALGEQQKWLEGVTTEEEWAQLMERLVDWYKQDSFMVESSSFPAQNPFYSKHK
jgi:hypothetical protein